jgi:hypothetical protein
LRHPLGLGSLRWRSRFRQYGFQSGQIVVNRSFLTSFFYLQTNI